MPSSTSSCRRAIALVTLALLSACQSPGAPASPPLPRAVATVTVGAHPVSLAAAGGFVYAASAEGGTLSAIDPQTDQVAATVPLDATPGELRAFPDQRTLLVTDVRGGRVLVVDPAQGHRVIQRVDVGAAPGRLLVDPDDGRTVFVALTGAPQVVKLTFDRTDRAVAPTRQVFETGAPVSAMAYAYGRLLVGGATLFDTATGAATALPGQGAGPVAVGVSVGEARATLVADAATGALTVRDLPTGQEVRLTEAGSGPTDAAVDAESAIAYVAMAASNEVAVIDYIRRQVVRRLGVGAHPGRIDPAPALPAAAYRVLHGIGGHELWVSNDGDGTVSVIDGERLAVRGAIAVGRGAHPMAFSGAKAYVGNADDGTVSVIDRRSRP